MLPGLTPAIRGTGTGCYDDQYWAVTEQKSVYGDAIRERHHVWTAPRHDARAVPKAVAVS